MSVPELKVHLARRREREIKMEGKFELKSEGRVSLTWPTFPSVCCSCSCSFHIGFALS